MAVLAKPAVKKPDALDLWSKRATSIPLPEYANAVADTEKLLVFSETGAGKTTFYLRILEYLKNKGMKIENLKMYIIFPDRPTGLVKLIGLIPKEFRQCVEILPVNNYEQTVIATATAEEALLEHFKKTGHQGWLVFELMENYWTFSQDFYCRQAYGTSMGEFFAQMQSIMSKGKAEKKTAYEAFAGPFGGPWPIIKFFHNFNWIDRIKRFPFNTVFTSELREEDNADSVFKALGYRPAGEKHNQHRMDTILYLSHKGNNYFMKPYKSTGYKKFYGEINITGKNAYEEHMKALDRLKQMGLCVSKIEDLESAAGITPPKRKVPVKVAPVVTSSKAISKTPAGEVEKKVTKEEILKKKPIVKKEEPKDSLWEI